MVAIVYLFAALEVILATNEPCENYDTLDASGRSVGNEIGLRCDSHLREGWYRITGGTGELMPTSCIHGGLRCGTGYSIWLNGVYPKNRETVNVTACASDMNSEDCCFISYGIQIKNCTTFLVYKLLPVRGCPQAYCFGSERPCPEGQTSDSGFSPGCHGTTQGTTATSALQNSEKQNSIVLWVVVGVAIFFCVSFVVVLLICLRSTYFSCSSNSPVYQDSNLDTPSNVSNFDGYEQITHTNRIESNVSDTPVYYELDSNHTNAQVVMPRHIYIELDETQPRMYDQLSKSNVDIQLMTEIISSASTSEPNTYCTVVSPNEGVKGT